jgi:hypothetical protein
MITNMNITRLIFYHQNEVFQIFNPKSWLLKVCDDLNNIKDSFYLNLWPHNVKHLMSWTQKHEDEQWNDRFKPKSKQKI